MLKSLDYSRRWRASPGAKCGIAEEGEIAHERRESSARSRSAQLKEEDELLRKRHGDEATTVLQLEARLRSLESQVAVLIYC